VDGLVELPETAERAARALAVTDQDVRRRKVKRQSAMKKYAPFRDEDPVATLIERGLDPDFFGAPYIWVQVGHLILGGTAFAAAVVSGNGIEFALFDLEGAQLSALRAGLNIVYTINLFLAIFMFQQEMESGAEGVIRADEREPGPDGKPKRGNFKDAIGWAAKGLLLGGVAFWQREGRIIKKEKRGDTPLPDDLSLA